jgi:WD40 repeat protein
MMRRVLSCIVALLALFVFSQTVRAQRFQEPCWIISTPARSRAVISSDGSYVLAASGSSIFLIAANSGQLLWKKDLGAEVWAISINKNGDYLVAGGEDNLISCFSRDGSFLWSFNTEGQVNAIAISADGKYVVASSTGGWIYLLDSGSLVWSRQFQATLVYTIAISEDGWYIAVGTYEPAGIYLFHRSSANPVWDYIPNNFPTSLAFSASGAYLTAGCADNSVYLFSSTSSTPLWVYPTDHIVSSVAISGDGMTIAAGSLGGKVYSLSQSGALKWSYLTGEDVVSVALSRDGSRLVSTGSQGTVHFFTDGKLHWLTRRKDECYSSLSSTGEFVVIAGLRQPNSLVSQESQTRTRRWNLLSNFWRSLHSLYFFSELLGSRRGRTLLRQISYRQPSERNVSN